MFSMTVGPGDGFEDAVTFSFYGHDNAVRFDYPAKGGEHLLGLLMPMHAIGVEASPAEFAEDLADGIKESLRMLSALKKTKKTREAIKNIAKKLKNYRNAQRKNTEAVS